MTRSPRSHFLLAVALTAMLGACSTPGPQPQHQESSAPTSLAIDPSVDYRDPSAVCAAFAAAVHRLDTTVDRDPADAYQRATAYLDATSAAALASSGPMRRTPLWQEWTSHRAYIKVRVGPYAGDALPSDTADQRQAAALVAVRPVGRDGWRGPIERHTVTCVLRPAMGGWRISEYEVG
ncbi:hypothetical protein [Micromonospora sonchi]|nr:hypothetical protein [Micromonospora sonchi]